MKISYDRIRSIRSNFGLKNCLIDYNVGDSYETYEAYNISMDQINELARRCGLVELKDSRYKELYVDPEMITSVNLRMRETQFVKVVNERLIREKELVVETNYAPPVGLYTRRILGPELSDVLDYIREVVGSMGDGRKPESKRKGGIILSNVTTMDFISDEEAGDE